MAMRSAGLLLYRTVTGPPEVLLVHPGGPYWSRRDEGAWSLPKGEVEADEDPLEVARREFAKELGSAPPDAAAATLGQVRQAGGKLVAAWALEGDLDADAMRSNTFTLAGHRAPERCASFPKWTARDGSPSMRRGASC